MDDQANGLRQLVRDVRQERQRRESIAHQRSLSTGPPRVALVAATPGKYAGEVKTLLCEQAAARGVRVAAGDSPAGGADWLLEDLGVGYEAKRGEAWERASVVLLATTPDPNAVLAAYATLKSAHAALPLPAIELVVCEASDAAQAQLVYESLRSTCELFLPLDFAGCTEPGTPTGVQSVASLADRLMAQLPTAAEGIRRLSSLATLEA